jgi:type II secretory pathway pseudopilin PulG
MKPISILVSMDLAGQEKRRCHSEQGYAMAALLVALSIMAVMMSVAMPVWKQTARREKEEELVFRGMQYVHAIGMFQRKFANAYPPNVDVLVEQRFLRKKFKDPITNDDFVPIPVGQGLPGSVARGGTPTTGTPAGGRGGAPTSTAPAPASSPGGRGAGGLGPSPGAAGIQTTAGISGVTSKSKDTSIRIYNGRSHYNEWAFVYTPQLQAGQGGVPGSGAPGQRGQPGGPGGQRGQPGTDPFGRGRGPGTSPFGPATSPFGNPGGGRGFGPGGQQPAQPIFGPQPTPRGRG